MADGKKSKDEFIDELSSIADIEFEKAEELYEDGCRSLEDVVERGLEGLVEYHQIDKEAAKKILEEVEKSKEGEGEDEHAEELLDEIEKLEQS
ncbi:MAG: hypothetical protein ACOCSJ_05660, partial [Candidatus Natronoplasma sp.]